jgi:hypothetical protein
MVYLPLVGLVALLILSVAESVRQAKKDQEAKKEKEELKQELAKSREDMERLLKGIGELESKYQMDIVRRAMEVTTSK